VGLGYGLQVVGGLHGGIVLKLDPTGFGQMTTDKAERLNLAQGFG
jgi:hypothetical protein